MYCEAVPRGDGGVIRSENAGMSSDNRSENLLPRISKVSAPTFVVCGLGDPKVRPIGVTDGLLVDIPVLVYSRYDLGSDGDG